MGVGDDRPLQLAEFFKVPTVVGVDAGSGIESVAETNFFEQIPEFQKFLDRARSEIP